MLLILITVPKLSVSLWDKSCPPHTRGCKGALQLGEPQYPPAKLLLGLHKNHHLMKISSPQSQRYKDKGDLSVPVRNRRTHSSPRAVPGQPQLHVRGKTQHQESARRLSGSPHRMTALPRVQGLLWGQGRALQDCTGLTIGCLGEVMKVGKGKDHSHLGSNNCGKIEAKGEKRSWFCVTNIGQDACLAIPATDLCSLSWILTKLLF